MPNSRLSRLLDKNDQFFEILYGDVEKQLQRQYDRELINVQNLIRDMYDKHGMPTLTEVRKYNRLVSLEAQISKSITALNGSAQKIALDFIKEAFGNAYYTTGFALETSTGLKLAFSELPAEAIKYASTADFWQDRLRGWNSSLEVNVKSEVDLALRINSREEVISGLTQGKPYAEVARAIKNRFEVTAGRAKTIATDQMHKSQSKGRLEGIKKAEAAAERLGIKLDKVWKYNHAAKEPRAWHEEADGLVADENGMFNVGGELLEAPGLGADPANNINCHCSAQVQLAGASELKQDKSLMAIDNLEDWEKERL